MLTPISRKPLYFVLPIIALFGALVGLLVGSAHGAGGTGALLGFIGFTGLAASAVKAPLAKTMICWLISVLFFIVLDPLRARIMHKNDFFFIKLANTFPSISI